MLYLKLLKYNASKIAKTINRYFNGLNHSVHRQNISDNFHLCGVEAGIINYTLFRNRNKINISANKQGELMKIRLM